MGGLNANCFIGGFPGKVPVTNLGAPLYGIFRTSKGPFSSEAASGLVVEAVGLRVYLWGRAERGPLNPKP